MLCSTVQLLSEGKSSAGCRRHAASTVAAAYESGAWRPKAAAAEPPLSSRRSLHQLYSPWTTLLMRGMSCCAGLGSPPPREIVVEYSSLEGDHDYTDEFIKLANAIEDAYPEFVVSGNPDTLQPREGAFEITSGDLILFSKLKMKRLPELPEVLRAINALPPPQCELS
ncbi:hypothetical protein GOP47_0007149 [Adiantum capillus-veneris]|uniref:Uncharacterized protein n=1 Tax=Adiantum capillus-veneris TaxID=13818 RepID=A0A9D4V051_ADICA|nr:hypothetical protein GOP47_0007149 [Adiantum capillus-veneris]